MLKTGQKVPHFTLPDQNGDSYSIQDQIGKKALVIYFYPKDETPGCVMEACTFRDQYEDFVEAGAEVIGISRDSVKSHRHFADKRNLPFTLLSDVEGKVHKLFELKPEFLGLLMPRATFVVDMEGNIIHTFSSQFLFKKHVEDALKAIRKVRQTA